MKLIKTILSLFLILSLFSCKESSDRKPNATGTGYATLVAYSTHGKHKRSDATLQLNKIGTIHTISLGRRKDPVMKLGDSTKVSYAVYGNEIIITSTIPTKYYSGKGYHSLKNKEW